MDKALLTGGPSSSGKQNNLTSGLNLLDLVRPLVKQGCFTGELCSTMGAVLQLFSFPVVLVKTDGRVCFGNSAASRLFGCDSDTRWEKLNLADLESSEPIADFLNDLHEKGEMPAAHYSLQLDSNTLVTCRLSGLRCTEQSDSSSLLLIFEPEELPLMNSLRIDLFEANPAAIWVVERHHFQFLSTNKVALDLLGQHAEYLRHTSLLDLLNKQDVDSFLTRLECVINDKSQQGALGLWRVSCRVEGRAEPRWLELLVNPIHYGGRHALAMIAFDETSRVQAEQETLSWFRDISHQRTELEEILDNMVDAVITINEKGLVEHCNPSTTKLFGYSAKELLGQNINTLMPADVAAQHDGYLMNYLKTGNAQIIGVGRDVTAKHKEGWEFPIRLSVSELPPAENGLRRFLGTCHDLTLLKEQEKQLLLNQKLGAVGSLANGVAHDFNNILGIISGYAELSQMELTDEPAGKYQEKILSACERAAVLTRKLLDFSSSKPGQEDILDIGQVIEHMDEMLVEAVTRSVNIHYQLQDNLWPVLLDKGGFENVLLNLAINARQAMQEGGNILVITRNLMIGALEGQSLGIVAGEYVQVSVVDNGCGMDEETKLRVFEPFFTTKGRDGTGLGLAQVYSFVHRSGGGIGLESTPGQGSRFELYFPRYHADEQDIAAQAPAVSNDIRPQFRQHASILLVDDEKELLSVTRAVLEAAGYRVLQANNVDDAMRLLGTHKIDVVLTDVVMPGRGGIYLSEQIDKYYPHVKVQLITGFASERSNQLEQENPYYRHRLIKPVSASNLMKRMAELLVEARA